MPSHDYEKHHHTQLLISQLAADSIEQPNDTYFVWRNFPSPPFPPKLALLLWLCSQPPGMQNKNDVSIHLSCTWQSPCPRFVLLVVLIAHSRLYDERGFLPRFGSCEARLYRYRLVVAAVVSCSYGMHNYVVATLESLEHQVHVVLMLF